MIDLPAPKDVIHEEHRKIRKMCDDEMILENDEAYGEDEIEMPTVVGDLILDDDELGVLRSRPEFALFERLDQKKFDEELNKGWSKIWWDRRKKEYKEKICIDCSQKFPFNTKGQKSA